MLRATFLTLLALGSASLAQSNGSTRPGGTNQLTSVEGCMNEWLFNGVMRLRVLDVQPGRGQGSGKEGWAVKFELRNGYKQSLMPGLGGSIRYNETTLVTQAGNTLSIDIFDSPPYSSALSKMYAPGAGSTFTVFFVGDPADLSKPQKILVPTHLWSHSKGLPFAKDPNFRVFLNCKK